MDLPLSDLSPWRAALLLGPPALYLLAAAAAALLLPGSNAASTSAATTAARTATAWRWARAAALGACLLAALSMAALALGTSAVAHGPVLLPLGDFGALLFSLRSDWPGALVMLLVGFIGWVIVGYSQPYLDGEPAQRRYLCSLLLTLAAVTLLLTTNNLMVLALAWIATSLALHGLLTFFDRRPQALLAAHKKFLASRAADLCLLAAIALVGHRLGTLEIDRAIAAVQALPGSDGALQAAALLFVTSAVLKCAQLPVHGWLIQVMEAPTPVSALLHAGVVNLGGFLLIRLGPLVTEVAAAQALLVLVGSVTAVVAAMVAMTRISIKVALAWSTCAQMGFMLMQCGLGLHALALAHLLAHSLYKAHAFLGAGGAVAQSRLVQMAPKAVAPDASALLMGTAAGVALVVSVSIISGALGGTAASSTSPASMVAALILALALAPMLAQALASIRAQPATVHGDTVRAARPALLGRALAAAAVVVLATWALHMLAGRGWGVYAGTPGTAWLVWVVGCFVLLLVLQSVVKARPHGALARRLYPWFFAGFYLDELFSRLTLRVWPLRLPGTATGPRLVAPETALHNPPGAL
ncbi:MAG: NADH-quinone oxidoreductase subunit L [Rubrivivax sp.]|nr:NADH-quinone oxidoreductase subunit L [Rubrivivax sp.]